MSPLEFFFSRTQISAPHAPHSVRISVIETITHRVARASVLSHRAALSCCLRKRSKHPAIANTGSSQRFTRNERLWCRTSSVLRAHHGFTSIRPQGRKRHASLALSRSVLLLAEKSKHQALTTRGLSQRFACIVAPLVSHIQRSTSASRLSRALATGSPTPAFAYI